MESQPTLDGVKRDIGSVALKIALCVLVVAILISLFRWTLIEFLTSFLEPVLEMGVLVVFLASVIWSLVHMIRARKKGALTALLPMSLNIVTALVVTFVPFTRLTTRLNFGVHHRARMEAVSAILDGKYENLIRIRGGGRGDFVNLPSRLSDLSSGGDVMVWHRQDATLVFFFSFRGVLDSFSGFVYSTNDSPPQQGEFGGRFVEIERLQPNWFWAASRN